MTTTFGGVWYVCMCHPATGGRAVAVCLEFKMLLHDLLFALPLGDDARLFFVCSRLKRVPEHVSTAIVVLLGGAILPAPVLPASTRISGRLKRVQEHSARVNVQQWGRAPDIYGRIAAQMGFQPSIDLSTAEMAPAAEPYTSQ